MDEIKIKEQEDKTYLEATACAEKLGLAEDDVSEALNKCGYDLPCIKTELYNILIRKQQPDRKRR